MWIDGRLATFIELGVGFNPDLAARDNVLLNGTMLGLSPREARRRYDAVIDFAELHEFVDLKVKNYSSGMLVRLAFSVMIQVDADVLLIDEVLAVGDAAFQQKCFDEFARLRRTGTTVLLVTHDMGAAQRFCDRAMVLERGRVVGMGDTRQVAEEYLRLNFSEAERAAVAEEARPPSPSGAGRRRQPDPLAPQRFGDGGGQHPRRAGSRTTRASADRRPRHGRALRLRRARAVRRGDRRPAVRRRRARRRGASPAGGQQRRRAARRPFRAGRRGRSSASPS